MSIADTANSIYYNGYTYSIGDLVTLKDRKLYKDSYGPSYITVDGDYVWKINQIYPTQEVKIFVKFESGSDYYQGYSGFVYPSQIASGGTPDKYTYSFNANGGSGAPSAMTKTYGVHFTFPSTKPTRTGYTFNGWYNSEVNNGTVYAAGTQHIGLPDQNITWYASWTANDYTITLNANGGSISSDKTKIIVTYRTGNFNVINDRTPTLKGHSFTGWYTAKTGGTKVYDASGKAVDGAYWDGTANSAYWNYAGNVTLYAQWTTNSYKLTIDPNGGTWNGSTSNQTFTQKYGTTKTISNPTRVGYNFAGWKLNGYGSFSNQTYTYGAGNGELVAQWTRIVLKVTFDASTNGGSPNSKKNVNYGDTVGTLPTPTKPFYKFIGWFSKAVGGTQISANNVITSNVTFYAQYKIDASVKVKYNGNNLPAIVWVKVNGAWKKCITWIKDNGKWNKSTGAD